MSHPHFVMSFRKRLKSLGYTDVSIRSFDSRFYYVTAVEPLAGFPVSVLLDLFDMQQFR